MTNEPYLIRYGSINERSYTLYEDVVFLNPAYDERKAYKQFLKDYNRQENEQELSQLEELLKC